MSLNKYLEQFFGPSIQSYLESVSKALQEHDQSKVNTYIFDLQRKVAQYYPSTPHIRTRILGEGAQNITYRYDDTVLKRARKAQTPLLGEAVLLAIVHYPHFKATYSTVLGKYSNIGGYPFPAFKGIGHTDGRPFLKYEFIPLILADTNNVPILEIIYQVALHLMILQATLKFVHRDLHSWNIGLSKRVTPLKAYIHLKGKKLHFTSHYKVYFLDVEKSCLQFDIFRLSGKSLAHPNRNFITCNTWSYDMQLFLCMLDHWIQLPKRPKYLQTIIKRAMKDLRICNPKKDKDAIIEQLAYEFRMSINTSNLPFMYPKNILYALIHKVNNPSLFTYEPLW